MEFSIFCGPRNHIHIALATRSHSSRDEIRAVTQGWINWAGPQEGTLSWTPEPTFHSFLQEHDVKLRTIAPEAHWQNATPS